MRFAAGIFTLMILKEPILKSAAYIVVFNIGAELLLDEFAGIQFGSALKFVISAGTLILAVVYAHVKVLHVLRPFWYWIGDGMADFNELLDWALVPVTFIFKISSRIIAFLLRTIVSFFLPKSVVGCRKNRALLETDCGERKKAAEAE
jgi:hypothetical protein